MGLTIYMQCIIIGLLCMFVWTNAENVTSFGIRECGQTADVAFLIDTSESLRGEYGLLDKWLLLREFLLDTLAQLPVSMNEIHVALVPFSTRAHVVYWFNEEQDTSLLQKVVLSHTNIGGNTNISGAIKTAREQVFSINNGNRPGVRKIIILVTDGEANLEPSTTFIEAREAKAQEINIYTIGVGDVVNEKEMEEISSDPSSYYSVMVPDFQSLTEKIRYQLLEHICNPLPPPVPICNSKADIVFIIDSSGSIRDKNPKDYSYDNWELILGFVTRIVGSMIVSQSDTRVAVIQYAEDVRIMMHLNQASSNQQVIKFIKELEHWSGATNTSGAIRRLRTEIFRDRRGNRRDAPNVAIIITDGESTVTPQQTLIEAEMAKRHGILLFTVGVTNDTNEKELTSIASLPKKDHYFNSTSFTQITRLLSKLIIHICQDSLCSATGAGLTEQEQYIQRIRCREQSEARCSSTKQLVWQKYPESLLLGYNKARIPNVDSATTCQMYCLQDPACKSIDFAPLTQECSISKEVKEVQKEELSPDRGADYYEWACLDESLPENPVELDGDKRKSSKDGSPDDKKVGDTYTDVEVTSSTTKEHPKHGQVNSATSSTSNSKFAFFVFLNIVVMFTL